MCVKSPIIQFSVIFWIFSKIKFDLIIQSKKPLFIFKHHYYFNTTEFGLESPTWINVIRDPLTWFESNFYFKRFGWERKPGTRTRPDQNLTIDQCVTSGSGLIYCDFNQVLKL